MLPFHLDTRATSAQKIPSTSHAWSVQHEAWNRGDMDRWLPAHRKADGENGPYCMGYHTRQDIPFQFALAESFTLCDEYFCSVMGPTWPNRMYWMTGMIDPEGRDGGPITQNNVPPGRIHVEDLSGTTGGSGNQLEGVSAGRQLRLQHAGEFQSFPASVKHFASLHPRNASQPGRPFRIRRDQ